MQQLWAAPHLTHLPLSSLYSICDLPVNIKNLNEQIAQVFFFCRHVQLAYYLFGRHVLYCCHAWPLTKQLRVRLNCPKMQYS